MKTKPLVILCVVGFVAVGTSLGLGFLLGSVVKAGVNRFGPKITQSRVELASAHISPFNGSGQLAGLTVGNPEGWSDNPAFYLGQIAIDLKPFSVFSDHIVINELIIDQPVFAYETRIVSSNLKELLKNIEAFTAGGGDHAKSQGGKPIKFVVKKLRLTNGRASLGLGPAALVAPLPPIALDNLGVAEGGITPDELAGVVMKNVLGSIVKASAAATLRGTGALGAGAVEVVGDAAGKAGEGIKKLLGK